MDFFRTRRFPVIFIGSLLLILAACGDGAGSQGSGDPEHDFAFVPYQGFDGADPESEIQFSEVFEQGKPVVLNFWAGQCPPCRAEMPHFQDLATEYEDDFILLGIDVGVFTGLGTSEDALALLEELDITYPVGRAVDQQPLTEYNATGMPTTVFFDANGEVVDTRVGMIEEPEMRERIEDLVS